MKLKTNISKYSDLYLQFLKRITEIFSWCCFILTTPVWPPVQMRDELKVTIITYLVRL